VPHHSCVCHAGTGSDGRTRHPAITAAEGIRQQALNIHIATQLKHINHLLCLSLKYITM
jgi:hypothetical protein